MATKLKPVDIAIVGLGWAGGIVAKELASTGLKIVAFERGGPRRPIRTSWRRKFTMSCAIRAVTS